MKNKKNLLLASVSALIILSISSVNAIDEVNSSTGVRLMNNNTGTGIKLMNGSIQQAKEAFKNTIQEQKELRVKMIEAEQERRQQIKQNLINFKNQGTDVAEAFSELSKEVTDELKLLRDQHLEDLKTIQEKLKNTDLTLEERDALKEELKTLNDTYAQKIKELVADNQKANDFIQQREEVRNQNEQLREENQQSRIEFRAQRNELVEQYKEKYANTLAKAMPRISDDKLEQVSTKINNLYETINSNTKISQTNKDKLLSQILSLKEIMQEELDLRNQEEEVINLDTILE